MMFRTAILLALCAGSVLASSAEDEIRAAEKAWASAVVKADAAALNAIYSPKLIYAHSTGVVQNREQFIDQLKSGDRKYDSIAQENIRVEPYGTAVVAHYLARMTGNVEKKPFNDHVMVMHVWVKEGGKWRLAAHQTTKVP